MNITLERINRFSESGKLIICGLKSLESLIHMMLFSMYPFHVPCDVYPMNSLSMLLQYYDNYSEDNSIMKCLLFSCSLVCGFIDLIRT